MGGFFHHSSEREFLNYFYMRSRPPVRTESAPLPAGKSHTSCYHHFIFFVVNICPLPCMRYWIWLVPWLPVFSFVRWLSSENTQDRCGNAGRGHPPKKKKKKRKRNGQTGFGILR